MGTEVKETKAEQGARIAGYGVGIVGLTAQPSGFILPHLAVKYDEGFVQGRKDRAFKRGAQDRAEGRPHAYPDEFRLKEFRASYDRGYLGKNTTCL